MKHIDLFSGIGGFALAVDTVWAGSEHIFCDYDEFCKQILKKHWPNSKIYGDIRTITNTKSVGAQRGNQQQWIPKPEQVDILTGGFPCQPFSAAGKRRGTEDNRYLWPEMFRIISTFKPTWVIAENVRGLVTWNDGMVLEQVCTDLESQGYEVQPIIIPAVGVNAPHRRDRIWFVAHRPGDRRQRKGKTVEIKERRSKGSEQTGELARGSERPHSFITNPESAGSGGRGSADGGQYKLSAKQKNGSKVRGESKRRGWDTNWLEVATELCGVDDGLPAGMDGSKFTKAGHRTQRLKALGNSIVPQVAIEIMKAIKLSTDGY